MSGNTSKSSTANFACKTIRPVFADGCQTTPVQGSRSYIQTTQRRTAQALMSIRKGMYFMASLEHCCLLWPEGQQAPAYLLPSCSHMHTPDKQEKRESSRHHGRATLTAQAQCAVWKQGAHSRLTGYLSWPDRRSSAVTQHFILKNPEAVDTRQWTSSWTEVKDPLSELYHSIWEILDQWSTQTEA